MNERIALLKELLYLELEMRRRANETLRLEDYLNRFPADTNLVSEVWRDSGLNDSLETADPATGEHVPVGEDHPKHSPASENYPKQAGKYQLLAEIGRGGMGAVLRARDPDFDRTLAVKMMLGRHRDRPDLEERFFEEAKITGQLQHPGIPPAHELGRLEDGRPFFAMKLIEGETLAEMLNERASGVASAPRETEQSGDSGADLGALTRPRSLVDLPRLLHIFEQICQTIAYAHSRGILHRDLKPLNVMVGAFGEVQVMDWGLAKVVKGQRSKVGGQESKGSRPESEAVTLEFDTEKHAGQTADWQAADASRGANASSRTRAGAVMGTPSYMAPEQARGEIGQLDERCDVFGLGAILCRILTGEPPFIGANAALVLAKASHGEIDHAFGRLDRCGADARLVDLCKKCLAPKREDRPRQAGEVAEAVEQYQQQVQQRLRAAELAKAQAQTKAFEERKRRRVSMTLALVVVLFVIAGSGALVWYFQDQANRRAAAQLAEQQRQSDKRDAEGRITPAADNCAQELDQLVADLRNPQQFYKLMSKLHVWDRRLANCEAHINTAVGVMVRNPKPIDVALKQRVEFLRKRVAGERNNFAICAKLDQHRLDSSTSIDGKHDPSSVIPKYRNTFREMLRLDVEHGDPETAAAQIRNKSIRLVLVAHLDHWAITAIHAKYDKNAPSRKQLDTSRDRLLTLASLCDVPNAWRDQFRKAMRMRDKISLLQLTATLNPRKQNPHIVAALAYVLATQRVQSVAILDLISAHYLDDFWLQSSLGLIAKDPSNKVSFYRAAVAVRESAHVHYNLGVNYEAKGERAKATEHYRRTLALDPKFAKAYNNLGSLYDANGDAAKAYELYRKAISADPKLASAHTNLGAVYAAKKEWAKAIEHYRKALAANPNAVNVHFNLGKLYEDKSDWDKAIEHYGNAIALEPKNANAHYNLGNIYVRKGDREKAMFHFTEAVSLDPKNAMAHNNLGIGYASKGELNKAIDHLTQALVRDPKLANAHANLGAAYVLQKDPAKAIAHYRKAITLDPKMAKVLNPRLALAHYILGNTFADKRDSNKAILHYQETIAIEPNNFFAHYNLGDVYGAKNRPDKALVHFARAAELKPTQAKPHLAKGKALLQLGKFAEAQEATEQCLRFLSQNSLLRGPAVRQLRECESLIQMENKLAQFDGNKANSATAPELLALASLCQKPYKKRYHQAAKLYRAAFRADPKQEKDLTRQYRYNAACAAALSAVGKGEDVGKIDTKKKSELRRQALAWLTADVQAWNKVLNAKPVSAMALQQYCEHAQTDPDLAHVRDAKALTAMAEPSRKAWQKLWSDVAALQNQARASYKETMHKGTLTAKRTEDKHEVMLTAGKIYVIDMRSQQFDTFLKLENAKGAKLAENDDIAGGRNLNSRITFNPDQSGAYRLFATSYQQRGRGAYEIIVREFSKRN